MNLSLIIGAFFGLTSVAIGAYANHAVALDDVKPVMLAVQYQQLHGVMMVIFGLAYYAPLPDRLRHKLNISAGFFTGGILLFAGVIYLKYLLGFSALGFLTPIGGLAFMIGWAVVIWAGFTRRA